MHRKLKAKENLWIMDCLNEGKSKLKTYNPYED